MAVIPVELAGRSYEVRVARGLLKNIADEAAPFLRRQAVPIVADATAKTHWGQVIEASLKAAGKEPLWLEVSPGESSKSWESLARLTDWLLAQGVERGDHVLALGGGVVGGGVGVAAPSPGAPRTNNASTVRSAKGIRVVKVWVIAERRRPRTLSSVKNTITVAPMICAICWLE